MKGRLEDQHTLGMQGIKKYARIAKGMQGLDLKYGGVFAEEVINLGTYIERNIED